MTTLEGGQAAPETPVQAQHRALRFSFPALLSAFGVWAAILGTNPRRVADFHIYLTAAARFLRGAELYPLADGDMPFKYAPAAAWLFVPFSSLPSRMAGALWNVGLVAALGAAAYLFNVHLRREGRAAASPAVLCAVVLALAQPLFMELFYGQVDLWMLVLLLGASLDGERRPWRAGLLWALAVLLKPTAIIAMVGFAVARQWRVVGWALAFGAVLFAPVLLRYGPTGCADQLQAWVQTLARTTPPWVLGYNPQGLPTLVLSFVYPPNAMPPNAVLTRVDVAVLVTFALLAALSRLRGAALWALLCFGAAYTSPLAWRANFVLALPMLTLLLLASDARWAKAGVAALVAVAAVGFVVNDGLLRKALFERVMLMRPFAVVFLACAGLLVWVERAPSGLPPKRRLS